MGVVYLARQLKLGRQVAIKMILADECGVSQLRRFQIEAEAVAQLQHANIVQIYDADEVDGQPYLVLEYIDGDSLPEKQAAGIEIREAVELVEQLSLAMDFSHRGGIVHRDLKPANVLITYEGVPKITDFGLAKRLMQSGGQTLDGSILGSPHYMSPEQAAGHTKDVNEAADVYALGAILYSLLAGDPPFHGDTVNQTLHLVQFEDAKPPSERRSAIPKDLDNICLRCLQKNPLDRYASAADLAIDLRSFLDGAPINIPAERHSSHDSPRFTWQSLIFGLLAAAVIVPIIVAIIWYQIG